MANKGISNLLTSGILTLLEMSGNNKKGQYYTTANWKGNGIANTDIGYLPNYNYQNPYDLANVLAGRGSGTSGHKSSGYSLGNNVLSKLSGIKGKVGDWASDQWSNMVNRKYGNTGDFYNNQYGIM